jgi:two-component system chemotaxis response regulator CheB
MLRNLEGTAPSHFAAERTRSTDAAREANSRRDIIAIGGSAGGTDAIAGVLQQLPADIPAAVFVVCHMLPNAKGHLVDMLNTAGPLVAKIPEDGEEIAHGMVYVAPADRHLLVKPGSVRITRGPRENRWRPAIDPLFRSAAVAYGPRVIGIVLTGMLDDGTAGLLAIKRCGGIAMVQDPEETAFPDMPRTALANVAVDHCLLISDMGPAIQHLLTQPVAPPVPAPRDIEIEVSIAETGYSDEQMTSELGELTNLSCPDCGGRYGSVRRGNSTAIAAGSATPTPRLRCFRRAAKLSKLRSGPLCACSTSMRMCLTQWRKRTASRGGRAWWSTMKRLHERRRRTR